MSSPSKVVTGAKASLSIGGKPILMATGMTYAAHTVKWCACKGRHIPEMHGIELRTAHWKLFNLLHKLLHESKYV